MLQRDQAHAAALGSGKRMKRSSRLGTRISAFMPRPSAGARKLQRDGEAEVGNERERMRRIDRERRQHREDVREEVVLEPASSRPW